MEMSPSRKPLRYPATRTLLRDEGNCSWTLERTCPVWRLTRHYQSFVPLASLFEDVAVELLEAKGIYLHPGHFYEITSNGCFIVSLITLEQSFSEASRQPLAFF
jgi:hypothetical protein